MLRITSYNVCYTKLLRSISNSGRWAQWRYKAVEPPGEAESDAFIVDQMFKRVKALYEKGGVFPEPIVNLAWNYGSGHEPDIEMVARECNGTFTRDVEIKRNNFV